jgi:hypothetical protein
MCEFFLQIYEHKIGEIYRGNYLQPLLWQNCKIPILPWPNQKIWAKLCKCSKKMKKSLTDERFK